MEEADDWFFESIRKYKNLFMYDLQKPATTFNWTSNEDLCVATSDGEKHEIIELALPDKLIKEENEANLTKDRDFRYRSGGSCTSQVRSLYKIEKTRNIVCSTENTSHLTLFELGGEKSDLIKVCGVIENPNDERHTSQLALATDACKVVFGSQASNICVGDIEQRKALFSFKDADQNLVISGIQFIDDHVCMCCCARNGHLIILDIRDDKSVTRKQFKENSTDCYWTLCEICGKTTSDKNVSTMSSEGRILVHDVRNLNDNCTCIQTPLHCHSKTQHNMKYTQCPSKTGIIGVSGFDNCVQIFDTTTCTGRQNNIEPTFVHKGHAVECTSSSLEIVSHIWHPETKDLIISSGNDGSLHAWQSVIDKT